MPDPTALCTFGAGAFSASTSTTPEAIAIEVCVFRAASATRIRERAERVPVDRFGRGSHDATFALAQRRTRVDLSLVELLIALTITLLDRRRPSPASCRRHARIRSGARPSSNCSSAAERRSMSLSQALRSAGTECRRDRTAWVAERPAAGGHRCRPGRDRTHSRRSR